MTLPYVMLLDVANVNKALENDAIKVSGDTGSSTFMLKCVLSTFFTGATRGTDLKSDELGGFENFKKFASPASRGTDP